MSSGLPQPKLPKPENLRNLEGLGRKTNPDLILGMIVDENNGMGQDVSAYTDSTTGTFRNNK